MSAREQVFVIAEAGVNHNGSLDMAKGLIDAAASAGADAVKFQTFRAENLASKAAPKADYQRRTTEADENQFDMLRRLELSEDHHDALISYAREKGIEFLSTPFDPISLRFLTERVGLSTIKVSSGDLTNLPFLVEVGRVSAKVILSTGMGSLGEIETALGALAYGFCGSGSPTGLESLAEVFASDQGQRTLRERVSILHCTTEYPAPMNETNLRAILTMRDAFGLTVGYSDHTPGISVSLAAVALGAEIIEKHFTLDRSLPGPDHAASLEPGELCDMVKGIREIESALGDGVKRPSASEWKNRIIARKSVVAARRIRVGEQLEVVCKRPGNGLAPSELWRVQGSVATRDYDEDEQIEP